MTSFAHPVVPHGGHGGVERPTLQEWTAAHQISDPNRRRVQLALLHDRMVASRMSLWEARFYLYRHAIELGALAVVGVLLALVDPVVYVPILVGLPAFAVWKAWRGTAA